MQGNEEMDTKVKEWIKREDGGEMKREDRIKTERERERERDNEEKNRERESAPTEKTEYQN